MIEGPRHDWFQNDGDPRYCQSCGEPGCTGRIAVDFCPVWQEAQARASRGEFLTTEPDFIYEIGLEVESDE